MIHMINCGAIRQLWRVIHPEHPFDGLELLGFMSREHHTQDRITLLCMMFGIFEFHRHWSHQPTDHHFSIAETARAIAHFAINSISQHRDSLVRHSIVVIRSAIGRITPQIEAQ